MSAWSDLEASLNTSVLATFGAPVTVTQGTTTTPLIAMISKLSGPWLADGQIQISQHAYQALVHKTDLATEPTIGTIMTTDGGAVYVVDQPVVDDNGLYRLVLKKRP